MIVYVDDILLTGDFGEELTRLKKFLAMEFEVKDLGNLRYFLGIEVARSQQGIFYRKLGCLGVNLQILQWIQRRRLEFPRTTH